MRRSRFGLLPLQVVEIRLGEGVMRDLAGRSGFSAGRRVNRAKRFLNRRFPRHLPRSAAAAAATRGGGERSGFLVRPSFRRTADAATTADGDRRLRPVGGPTLISLRRLYLHLVGISMNPCYE